MFNDVLTSSKGPGVIGLLLAIVVLGGFSGLGLMVLNSDGYEEPPIEDLIKSQESRLADVKEDIEEGRVKMQTYRELQNLDATRSIHEKRLERQQASTVELKAEAETVVAALDAKGEEWEAYKAAYRENERRRIKGQKLDLSSTLGKRYESVLVSGANPIELRVMLSSGPRGIPYAELPADLQDLLQFTEEEANAYLGVIAKVEKAKGKNIAAFNQQQAEIRATQDAAKIVARISQLKRKIDAARLNARTRKEDATRHRATARTEQAAVRAAIAAGRMSSGQSKVTKANARAAQAEKESRGFERSILTMQAQIQALQNM